MDDKLNALFELLDEIEDEKEWLEVLDEVVAYAPHHPQVLYIRALQSENIYETLEHLDHAFRHLGHTLREAGAFDAAYLDAFGSDEESELYLHIMMGRLMVFLDLHYDYEAFAQYNEIAILDTHNRAESQLFGMRVAMRLNNLVLAQSIHEQYADYSLSLDFLFAVILHNGGLEEEAISLLRPYVDDVPFFKEALTRIVKELDFDEDLAMELGEFLPVLVEGLDGLKPGLLEVLVESYH